MILALSSCQTTWTPKQKAALNTLSVPSAIVNANSCQKPQTQSAESKGTTLQTTQSAFGLAGVLVSAAIMQAAQTSYAAKNGQIFTQIEAVTPKDKIAGMVQEALTKRLSNHSFFAGKITSTSPNKLEVKVTRYGLQRLPVKADLHAPGLGLSLSLILADGQRLMTIVAYGNSYEDTNTAQGSATLAEYVADPKKLEAHYAIAADEAARKVITFIQTKLGS